MNLQFMDRFRDLGLLILRLGIGFMFIMHGLPKINGGPVMWEKLGLATGNLGIHVFPVFFGFMCAFAEFGGGILLILGFYTRLAALLMFINMAVAVTFHLSQGDGFNVASHAIEAAILFFSLILIGPGTHSIDEKIKGAK